MGLFDLLFNKTKQVRFVPNPRKSEYENLLDFISCGGTSAEWERLKKANRWVFPESNTEKFMRYQKEVDEVANKYFELLGKIENDWSVLYNLKEYSGNLAFQLEQDCLADIDYYKAMRAIDRKYGHKTATNIPAFRRLAMLYEKQGKFEAAVRVCKEACKLGMDERSRMARMIKKAGRTPTTEELKILGES